MKTLTNAGNGFVVEGHVTHGVTQHIQKMGGFAYSQRAQKAPSNAIKPKL